MRLLARLVNDYEPFTIFIKTPPQVIGRVLNTPLYILEIASKAVLRAHCFLKVVHTALHPLLDGIFNFAIYWFYNEEPEKYPNRRK